MIRIFDKETRQFNHLGLGSLDETIAAVVIEELNGSYELEIEYPITGRHFDKLQHRNIIFCKPNAYTSEQPFRIYDITRPFEGKVTINAEHVSYDASGVTILPKRNLENGIEPFGDIVVVEDKEGAYLDTILTDINGASAIENKNYFNLTKGADKNNIFKEKGFSIPKPTNLRSLIGGMEGSILDEFKGEYLFSWNNVTNKCDVILRNRRGVDRGITIRYGKNMTDLEQETNGSNLFTSIFPFYSKAYSESHTSTARIFRPAYSRDGVTPLRSDWLSSQLLDPSTGIGGITLKPLTDLTQVLVDATNKIVDMFTAIRVKTPGEYFDKIYVFKKNNDNIDEGPINLIKAFISQSSIINDKEVITELKLNLSDINPIQGVFGMIYVIQNQDSTLYNRKIIYDKNVYIDYDDDGFYIEAKDATEYPTLSNMLILPLYPIRYDDVESKWVKDYINGSRYVRPVFPNVGTVTVDKYVYLDLKDYDDTTVKDLNSQAILENGVLYINSDLKNLEVQRVLTLDLTEELDNIDGLQPTQMTKDHLFNKAEQYLKDNDFTKLKDSITISFIKLSDSPEYEHLKQLEIVELGDDVSVIYEALGVNSKHRVISTEYNVLTGSYNEIELGDKVSTITSNVVSIGDNVSNLKNDAEYADKQYIVKLIAENAEIVNAAIQNAVIDTLTSANVSITNSLSASWASIDALIANLFTANNAEIAKALIAGTIRVKGDFVMDSGSITINRMPETDYIEVYISEYQPVMSFSWFSLTPGGTPIDPTIDITAIYKVMTDGYYKDKRYKWNDVLGVYKLISTYVFSVDRDGNVIANALTITGGSIDIGDNFYVSNEGILTAKGVKVMDGEISINNDAFRVTPSGEVSAKSIEIEDLAIIEEINAQKINVNKITASKIYLNDEHVWIERVTENNAALETHTVNVTGSATLNTNAGYTIVNISLLSDVHLYTNKIFTVTIYYLDAHGISKFVQTDITILKDQNQGSGSVTIYHYATSWSYLGTSGVNTHTTSYGNNEVGCPTQIKAQSNLPSASLYVLGNVIKQSVYDDALTFCIDYYYETAGLYPSINLTPGVFPKKYTESRATGELVATDKIVINAYGIMYDIITGIVDQTHIIRFFSQPTEPDTTNLEHNSLWFEEDVLV